MVKIKTKKFSVDLVNKKVATLINDMADMFVGQTKTGVEKGTDVDGRSFRSLKPSTIKQKRKRGYRKPTKPLLASGKMANVKRTRKASSSNLLAEVDVNPSMRDIAEYHNQGAGNLPQRLWFGIGTKVKSRFDKFLKARVRKLIKIKVGKLK